MKKWVIVFMMLVFCFVGVRTVSAATSDAQIFCGGSDKTASPTINTAIGCIPINFLDFVTWIFKNGFGIVGGIAFLLLIGAFIQLATSEGDVKKIQGVKETITSIATGLLLSLFSVFIIRTLMINILHIPGLK